MPTNTRTNKSAAPAAPAATETAKAPALDFAALSAETVAEMPKSTRTPKVEKTPFLGWMKETVESGKAKRVTVPNANVKDVENLVRQAANALNKGAKIRKSDAGNGQTAVTFQAAERRAYKPRTKK